MACPVNGDRQTAFPGCGRLARTALASKKARGIYDAIFSYNPSDEQVWQSIGGIHRDLERIGLRVWLDKMALIPGSRWREGLDDAIENVNAAAVFLGHKGIGLPQQYETVQFICTGFARREFRVIPVLVAGVERAAIPEELAEFTCVDLGEAGAPLNGLVAGIIGCRPESIRKELKAHWLHHANLI